MITGVCEWDLEGEILKTGVLGQKGDLVFEELRRETELIRK